MYICFYQMRLFSKTLFFILSSGPFPPNIVNLCPSLKKFSIFFLRTWFLSFCIFLLFRKKSCNSYTTSLPLIIFGYCFEIFENFFDVLVMFFFFSFFSIQLNIQQYIFQKVVCQRNSITFMRKASKSEWIFSVLYDDIIYFCKCFNSNQKKWWKCWSRSFKKNQN